MKPGFLIKSLSEHYNTPGRLAEYKRQFQRAVRRPGDDPSIFATELQTLARRAFMDIDLKIQSQMVRDRLIDGQAECALRRHLDSLGPNTPIPDIVDIYRIFLHIASIFTFSVVFFFTFSYLSHTCIAAFSHLRVPCTVMQELCVLYYAS